jgi:hypothetical protein
MKPMSAWLLDPWGIGTMLLLLAMAWCVVWAVKGRKR